MIRKRMRILEENARREEETVRAQARVALGKEALRMQYERRPGLDRARLRAADRSRRRHRPSLETAVWRLAGKKEKLETDRAVGRSLADATSTRMAEEIISAERTLEENIRARKRMRDEWAQTQADVTKTRIELLRFVRAEHADAAARLDAALAADRKLALLERVSSAGEALYRTMGRIEDESRGAGRYAVSDREKAWIDIPLREAYAAQGERKAAALSAARTAFLAEWRTWRHWHSETKTPAAPRIFSTALWDTAPALLSGQRRGDEWVALLSAAREELAALLIPIEIQRRQAREERAEAYESAGLPA